MKTILHAATLKQKLKTQFPISTSHSKLTLGKTFLALAKHIDRGATDSDIVTGMARWRLLILSLCTPHTT